MDFGDTNKKNIAKKRGEGSTTTMKSIFTSNTDLPTNYYNGDLQSISGKSDINSRYKTINQASRNMRENIRSNKKTDSDTRSIVSSRSFGGVSRNMSGVSVSSKTSGISVSSKTSGVSVSSKTSGVSVSSNTSGVSVSSKTSDISVSSKASGVSMASNAGGFASIIGRYKDYNSDADKVKKKSKFKKVKRKMRKLRKKKKGKRSMSSNTSMASASGMSIASNNYGRNHANPYSSNTSISGNYRSPKKIKKNKKIARSKLKAKLKMDKKKLKKLRKKKIKDADYYRKERQLMTDINKTTMLFLTKEFEIDSKSGPKSKSKAKSKAKKIKKKIKTFETKIKKKTKKTKKGIKKVKVTIKKRKIKARKKYDNKIGKKSKKNQILSKQEKWTLLEQRYLYTGYKFPSIIGPPLTYSLLLLFFCLLYYGINVIGSTMHLGWAFLWFVSSSMYIIIYIMFGEYYKCKLISRYYTTKLRRLV